VVMKKHWMGILALVLALATVACGSYGVGGRPEPPTSRPQPTLTSSSDWPVRGIELPMLVEGDLVALYAQLNPGVVAIQAVGANGVSTGTGFVFDSSGTIVTNQHVVSGADQIEVDFSSGAKIWAELVGTEANTDLAVLQVDLDPTQLVPLPLGDSSQVQVGQFVVAIGNPFGLAGTMTVGIVSGLGRTLDSERSAPGGGFFSSGDMIQTDAAINPGNSGGPLVNLAGEVVGVTRAIRTESFTVTGDAANSGVGFAIPINLVRRVITGLIEDGSYEFPYLGIASLSDLDLQTIEDLGLPRTTGAYITSITPGSPADHAGLQAGSPIADPTEIPRGGDLIIAIDEHPVRQFSDLLTYLVNDTEVGQTIILTVLRQGEEVEVELTIGARP
jgi:S1-C subfamily serine protease